jgi:hypothetical protein
MSSQKTKTNTNTVKKESDWITIQKVLGLQKDFSSRTGVILENADSCQADGNTKNPDVFCSTGLTETDISFNTLTNLNIEVNKPLGLIKLSGTGFNGNKIFFNSNDISADDNLEYTLKYMVINPIPQKSFSETLNDAELDLIYYSQETQTYVVVSILMETAQPLEEADNSMSFQFFLDWGKEKNWTQPIPEVDLDELFPEDAIKEYITYISPNNSKVANIVLFNEIKVPQIWINKLYRATVGGDKNHTHIVNNLGKYLQLSKQRMYIITTGNFVKQDTGEGTRIKSGKNALKTDGDVDGDDDAGDAGDDGGDDGNADDDDGDDTEEKEEFHNLFNIEEYKTNLWLIFVLIMMVLIIIILGT